MKRISKISLDSDSSGDDGGQPPRKKTRRTTTAKNEKMQSSNGLVQVQQNGAPSCSNGAAENGHGDTAENNGFFLNQTNQEIVRLIGQYLKNEGLT